MEKESHTSPIFSTEIHSQETLDSSLVTIHSIDILYEEGPCLAINKPAGLLTQAAPKIDSLEQRVKDYLSRVEGGGRYLGIPHRLDRPVSGVILFGKNSRATRRISEQLERREIDKRYWAIVEGHLAESQGTWIDYMRKVPDEARAEPIAPIHPDAREAILHYTVLKQFYYQDRPVSHLEINLETGRMHQIRLQLCIHGHPIIGDAQYGSTIPFGKNFETERLREIALHARSIDFVDPTTHLKIHLVAPLSLLWEHFSEISPIF
ncbi:MAG: RluA family pseudouridine synthase [Thermoguttaceae bacterium]